MTQICVGLGEEGRIVRNSRCITANPVSHSDWSMESLQVGWPWDWKREISIFSTRRVWGGVGESNLRAAVLLTGLLQKSSQALSWNGVLNLTLPMSEREKKEKNRAEHQSEAEMKLLLPILRIYFY